MGKETRFSRRRLLIAGGALSGGAAGFLRAHGAVPLESRKDANRGSVPRQMHGGRGVIDVRFFFEPERPSRPALFIHYDIPPGASEGVHTHGAEGPNGPWDEFYYIISGTGRMNIDGKDVPVEAGDNVHTPLGVAHGIQNTSAREPLRVYLVAISRD